MAKDLLFEIGVEEMPAGYMPRALEDLAAIAADKLTIARLAYTGIRTLGTPRRLALMIDNLAEGQEDHLREVRGPRRDKGYGPDGAPTQAVLGFARGQGVAVEDLVFQEVGGVEYVFAKVMEKGQSAAAILPDLLKEIMLAIPFPKSMKWGYYETRFPRPIRWLTALFGSDVLPVVLENLTAGNTTRGHRFFAPEPIALAAPSEYTETLRKAYVIVDPAERRELIWKQVAETASAAGGRARKDEALLDEVNYLAEYPNAFLGAFSADYLVVPPEVLTTSMKEHQRYFPVEDANGKLMACFIGVTNGDPACIPVIREGNQRVLRARLEDAHFFYKVDTEERLETRVELLKNVVYQQKLGTVFGKTERLVKLAGEIASAFGAADRTAAKRAAFLCKADLETHMVYEFPELQGLMGRYYALVDREDPVVAEAIFEHYLPRFAGDAIPVTLPGTALSLAEKMDNLIGNFAIGVRPTGSQDPFALRRQALGIVAIILGSTVTGGEGIDTDLVPLLRESYRSFAGTVLDQSEAQTVNDVLDFILQRFRGVLQDEGLTYDLLDAVFAVPCGDLLALRDRARSLADLKQEPILEDVLTAFSRPYNLAKKGGAELVDPALFAEAAEHELFKAASEAAQVIEPFLAAGDYASYFKVLAKLRPVTDAYFEKILVMAEDPAVRENRLGQLKQIASLFTRFADLSKLVV
ncbi:MAG: glycine--tRNA ligase subunit beta [Solirubrobacterales bacterium]